LSLAERTFEDVPFRLAAAIMKFVTKEVAS
jgi:hypothetical protein